MAVLSTTAHVGLADAPRGRAEITQLRHGEITAQEAEPAALANERSPEGNEVAGK